MPLPSKTGSVNVALKWDRSGNPILFVGTASCEAEDDQGDLTRQIRSLRCLEPNMKRPVPNLPGSGLPFRWGLSSFKGTSPAK